MTQYFFLEDLESVRIQRKKVLSIYFLTLAIYLAFALIIFICYWQLPYMPSNSPEIRKLKWIFYPVTIGYIVFSLIYLSIIYGRVNKFYKLCRNMKFGLKESYVGEFLRYNDSLEFKDGVDFKSLILKEWNKYKKSYFERKVLVFYEKPFPEMQAGQIINYTVQGNVLLEYEIVNIKETDNESNSNSNR